MSNGPGRPPGRETTRSARSFSHSPAHPFGAILETRGDRPLRWFRAAAIRFSTLSCLRGPAVLIASDDELAALGEAFVEAARIGLVRRVSTGWTSRPVMDISLPSSFPALRAKDVSGEAMKTEPGFSGKPFPKSGPPPPPLRLGPAERLGRISPSFGIRRRPGISGPGKRIRTPSPGRRPGRKRSRISKRQRRDPAITFPISAARSTLPFGAAGPRLNTRFQASPGFFDWRESSRPALPPLPSSGRAIPGFAFFSRGRGGRYLVGTGILDRPRPAGLRLSGFCPGPGRDGRLNPRKICTACSAVQPCSGPAARSAASSGTQGSIRALSIKIFRFEYFHYFQ